MDADELEYEYLESSVVHIANEILDVGITM